MEPLYQTSTIYNYDEYKRYSWNVMYNRKRIITLVLLELWILLMGIFLKSIFLIVFSIVYPILIPILQNRQIKKIYNSNKAAQNMCANFAFYDTYFTETDENGDTKLEYTKLHKIIETKTNFYLMTAKNQGFVLNKSNFPEGLADFLRSIKL